MSTVRYWPYTRLMATWLAALACVGLARYALVAGTYQGILVSREVTIETGLWPPAFASSMTVVLTVAAVVTLLGISAMWVAGRKDREAREQAETSEHRSVLM
jgi:hypothetical protein